MPKFQDKPTVVTNDLSNTTAYFPMVQSGLNKKATIPQIKRDAVANCSTAAGTVAKTATIRNMPDFELLSGIVVTVAFTNTNTAESPTLNINNTGAWPIKLENQASNVTIGNGCWVAGAILEFKYVEVSDTGKYWLLVGHNVAQQTSEYTILADGTFEYSKEQTDNAITSKATKIVGLGYCYKASDYQLLQLDENFTNFKMLIFHCALSADNGHRRILHTGVIICDPVFLRGTYKSNSNLQFSYSDSDYSMNIYFDYDRNRIWGQCKSADIAIYGIK